MKKLFATAAFRISLYLSYLRNAQAYEHMSGAELEGFLPAVLNAVEYLDQPEETALGLIAQMLKRHGKGVSDVMRGAFREGEFFLENSLPKLYGEGQVRVVLPIIEVLSVDHQKTESVVVLEMDESARHVLIDAPSKTIRTARSRTSGENLFVVLLMKLHPTQELEPPANPVRFSSPIQFPH